MTLFEISPSVVIYIGAYHVRAKLLNSRDQAVTITHDKGSLYENNYESMPTMLDEAVAELTKKSGKKIKAMNVVLSDPACKYTFFEFEKMPADKNTLRQIVMARLAKEFHITENNYNTQLVKHKNHKGAASVGVYAVHSLMINVFFEFARKNGMILRSVNIAYNHIHNFIDGIAPRQNEIFVYLENEYWTTVLINKNKQVEFLRSKWVADSEPSTREKTMADIAVNLRTLLQAKKSESAPTISYLCAGGKDTKQGLVNLLQGMTTSEVTDLLPRLSNKSPLLKNDATELSPILFVH